jgi:hypothetical protein
MTEKERDVYEWLLENWRVHCLRDGEMLGFKKRDAILQSDGSKDAQQLYDAADQRNYEAVEACVSSLPDPERHAIWRIKRVQAVWQYRRLDFEVTLNSAERLLLAKMKQNSGLWIFF